jgi:transcriptional regulator with XRE-family HTH domain
MRLTDSALGALRLRAGYTQEQAALKLAKHQTQISDLERGEYAPSEEDALALAELYGTTAERIRQVCKMDGKRYARKLLASRRTP